MSKGLNKVMLIGWVDGTPEMRHTPTGRPVTSFSISTPRTWTTPDGERREETEWFNIVAWSHLAELCNKRLTPSAHVYVEGRLQTRSWEGKDGRRHFRTEIVANEIIVLTE